MTTSDVDFPTPTRVHFGLAVHDLSSSRAFYEKLLAMAPTKVRENYVKFESHDPPLNLTLSRSSSPTVGRSGVTHFGIQVKSRESVAAHAARLAAQGLTTRKQESVSCCYAVQDKVWVTDPDGNDWEIFVVTDADAPDLACSEGGDPDRASEPIAPCC